MALAPGVRLGAYEIVALIGAGGMGEVYRARDTRLRRDVAIKVLPDAFTNDADRLARFKREAHVLGSLNHPNIAAIYGLEETARGNALVLELVEGPTLADRIAEGPIPLDEALPIARQIAEALGAAHEHGIIHRDLKPVNIKLTSAGTVKVLDFGLAKAIDPITGDGSATQDPAYFSASPTVTSPGMTRSGVILGTAPYMSPEQARGRPLDKRTDIWTFGCVLYEMLSGKRAFAGEDVTDSLALVITKEPNWNALPENLPSAVVIHLRRCLEKDCHNRIQDIGDMRLALEGAFDVPATGSAASAPAASLFRSGAVIAAAALVLVAAGSMAGWFARRAPPETVAPVRRFLVTASPAQLSRANMNRDFAISPDGSRLAYFASAGGKRQIHVRSLGALTGTPLRDVQHGFEPFFSPDGQWIGYNDETNFTLRKIAVTGGPPIGIGRVGREILGAAWAPDDSIIYATIEAGSGLWRLPATATAPIQLTRPDAARGEVSHGWPEILPGGRGVVYSIRTSAGYRIGALDLASGEQKVILQAGTAPRFLPPNHLVYGLDDALFAVAFDPVRLEVVGQPAAIVHGVNPKPNGSMDFGVSRDGTLVYAGGSDAVNKRRVFWVDRTGKAEPLNVPPRRYLSARLSPDGSRMVLDTGDQSAGIMIWDINRGVMTPLSSDAQLETTPTWTPDGLRIVLASGRGGARNVYMRSADGTGPIDRLTSSHNEQSVDGLTPDGLAVVVTEAAEHTGFDLIMASTGAQRKVTPLLQTRYSERNGAISADGRLVAYQSDESGVQDVWVRPFPNVERGRLQVSTGGGVQPTWSGRELLYITPDGRMMSATIATLPTLRASAPKPVMDVQPYLFDPFWRAYDIAPDGKRFLMIEKSAESDGIVVVLNWVEEIRQKLARD
jgi:eukaryotic-like serine/threonine-protein kinase